MVWLSFTSGCSRPIPLHCMKVVPTELLVTEKGFRMGMPPRTGSVLSANPVVFFDCLFLEALLPPLAKAIQFAFLLSSMWPFFGSAQKVPFVVCHTHRTWKRAFFIVAVLLHMPGGVGYGRRRLLRQGVVCSTRLAPWTYSPRISESVQETGHFRLSIHWMVSILILQFRLFVAEAIDPIHLG